MLGPHFLIFVPYFEPNLRRLVAASCLWDALVGNWLVIKGMSLLVGHNLGVWLRCLAFAISSPLSCWRFCFQVVSTPL